MGQKFSAKKTKNVLTVFADFNAADVDGSIRLDTIGSIQSLAETSAQVGDRVWISDGEIRTVAILRQKEDGLVADPVWETLEHLD